MTNVVDNVTCFVFYWISFLKFGPIFGNFGQLENYGCTVIIKKSKDLLQRRNFTLNSYRLIDINISSSSFKTWPWDRFSL